MRKESVSTDKAPKAIGPYSQAIRAGGMLFVSGQIPLDPGSGELVRGDIKEQTRRVLENVKAVLEAGGASLDDVVRCTIFLKDMSDFQAVNEVYGQFFREPYPSRACVEVARLPRDVGVEIDAIAKV